MNCMGNQMSNSILKLVVCEPVEVFRDLSIGTQVALIMYNKI